MIPRTRWQRIQSLFEEVIDVPAPERASRLADSRSEEHTSELQSPA